MTRVLLDVTKIKVYEALGAMAKYADVSRDAADELWRELLENRELYQELLYYVGHHSFLDQFRFCGYSMSDLYIWQLAQDNLIHDTGKNTEASNKERIVLMTFFSMVQFIKMPEKFRRKLEGGAGMDMM